MPHSAYFSKEIQKITPEDIVAKIEVTKTRDVSLFKKFVDYAFVRTSGHEFWRESPEKIADTLWLLWDFIQHRNKNEMRINLFSPPSGDVSYILISQDDAPYIVDSLQMALNKFGLEGLPIFSVGGLPVVRTGNGYIKDVLFEDDSSDDVLLEDPVLIQLAHLSKDAKVCADIEHYITATLADIHTVHNDQPLMREKCQTIVEELIEYKRHLPSEETREAITFLKWLLEDHFYFFGYRAYNLNTKGAAPTLDLLNGSGLGLLKSESGATKSRALASMPEEAQRLATPAHVLVITKTNTKSRIHRAVYTDYISIKHFDKDGNILGEYRFIGLFSHTVYTGSIKDIPVLRKKTQEVLVLGKAGTTGYRGKSMFHILETFPRDDLFQMSAEALVEVVNSILAIRERHVTRLIVRKDAYGRFYSCIVYVPREKITVDLYKKFGAILLEKLQGNELSQSMQMDDSVLARLHYVVRISAAQRDQKEIDFPALEASIIAASKTWKEKFSDLLSEQESIAKARMMHRYGQAFSLAYQEDFSPIEAIRDLQYLEEVYSKDTMAIRIDAEDASILTLKLFQAEQAALSEVIPILENMGLQALEENAYKCVLEEKNIWISSYRLRIKEISNENFDVLKPLFYELFFAVWNKKIENDCLNALVLKCALPANLVVVLRAYCAYYRQVTVYSQLYLETVLSKHHQISKKLLRLFVAQFSPVNAQETEVDALKADIKADLAQVTNLEEDKVLRAFLALIQASLRTNYYVRKEGRNYLSFKLESSKVPGLPLPHPLYEIFVYAPDFEAIHLRAAKVARGGIRWSDRREDFRTEVLGLMKAQQVKNTVIVPAGSKGGFVLKREASQQEAIRCYKNFMRGLLDITDNLVEGVVISPPSVKVLDAQDPYLVVAADKGTATFSDYANEVAAEYNFWLGDAFASGGSHGYDHKKIAITARGAWISVEAHLKALGINPSKDTFTAIGIGDMSGDVFGNGMLLSSTMQLVAAFNHQHIFIDPTPDGAKSFAERKRLFALPRSSWLDYDAALISKGGGVFERTAKSIVLSPEIKQLLGLDQEEIEPSGLIRAILCASVDLFFNGGIGTYVKATTQRQQDVGDKVNDALRVNASELRCRVVGEGGNLGFTQLARVEYAQKGGLIFTDFIDNSAGVDLSDHEVNTKILLAQPMQQGQLHFDARNQLLADMTTEVAALVLTDNKSQTETLSYASAQAVNELEVYMRWIQHFEQRGLLNREVEALPSEKTLVARLGLGQGLTAPEIAVVMAYVKMHLKQEILQSDLPENAYFASLILKEFPQALNERFSAMMPMHPLRREIITTQLANNLLDEAGILFIQRLKEETNATIPMIVSCFAVTQKTFDLSALYADIKRLDFQVALSAQHNMRKHLTRLVRRSARWLIRQRIFEKDIAQAIQKLAPIQALFPKMKSLLCGIALKKYEQMIEGYIKQQVPAHIATTVANVYSGYLLLGINKLSEEIHKPLMDVATCYFKLGEILGVDWLRDEITNQSVANRWEALLHSSLRDDLDYAQIVLTQKAMLANIAVKDLEKWLAEFSVQFEAWRNMLVQLQHTTKPDYVMYTVALNVLKNLG